MSIFTNPLSQEAKLKKNKKIITRELLLLKLNSKNEIVCRIIDIILSEFEGQELLITEEIMQMNADILSTLEKAKKQSY